MPTRKHPRSTDLLLLVALSVATTLLASCGSSATPPTGSPASTRPTPGSTAPTTTSGPAGAPCGVVAGPGVVITSRPEPCDVSTRVGGTISIVLDAGFSWNTPTSDTGAVEVADVQRQPSGSLSAVLQAARVGQATVSAGGSVLCPPGQACPALARLWQLHVTVTP